jgi:hypothetical protein
LLIELKWCKIKMKKFLIIILLLLAGLAGYSFYEWQINCTGKITVTTPKDTDIVIEGEGIYIKTVNGYRVTLGYGRYFIHVPEFKVECLVHKNNRGNVIVQVTDVNEFTVQCNSNAWVVKDAVK